MTTLLCRLCCTVFDLAERAAILALPSLASLVGLAAGPVGNLAEISVGFGQAGCAPFFFTRPLLFRFACGTPPGFFGDTQVFGFPPGAQ